MKILFVTPPPDLPSRLNRVRVFDLINILSKNHEIHLLSVTTEKGETKEFQELVKKCRTVTVIRKSKIFALINILRHFNLPAEVAYCQFDEIQTVIRRVVKKEKIDLVYLKRLRSAFYFPAIDIPVVLDSTDAMSMFYLRMAEFNSFPKKHFYLYEAIKYRDLERKLMQKFNNWIVCSEIDKGYLQSIVSKTNIEVVPNPIGEQWFASRINRKLSNLKTLVFRGLMDKPVNISAVRFLVKEIFPLIVSKIPNVQLIIAGPNPSQEILNFNNGKSINVTGYVPNLLEYMTPGVISVCPMQIGSGTRHKILQSWAAGIPVVSTSVGAEGLSYVAGKNIEIADGPQEFAKKVIGLFKNPQKYQTISKNGRLVAKEKYSYEVIFEILNGVLKNVSK